MPDSARAADKTPDRAIRAMHAVAGLALVVMMLVVVGDVVLRALFDTPIQGAYDVVGISLLVMTMFGIGPVVARRGEILIDLVDSVLPSPGLKLLAIVAAATGVALFARLIDTASAIFMVFIAYAIWPELQRSWGTGAFFGTPGIFTAPYWPIHLAILVSSILSAAIFVTKALTGRRRPEHLHLEESGA